MIRVQAAFIASVALALALPFAAATARTVTGEVGTAGPVAGEFSSTTMLKAEMKQGLPYDTPGYTEPALQSQVVPAAPSPVAMAAVQSCGPANVVALTDEYGNKYNCRGDRLLH
jgi:hypothetical protein